MLKLRRILSGLLLALTLFGGASLDAEAYTRRPTDALRAAFNGGGQTVQSNANSSALTDYIDCGNSAALSSATATQFTFAGFFKRLDTSGAGPSTNFALAGHWEWGANTLGRWILEAAGTNHDRVFIQFSNGIGQDTSAGTVFGTNSVFTSATEIHVAFTYSAGTVQLFVNGVRDTTATIGGAIPVSLILSSVHLSIARWQGRDSGTIIPGPIEAGGIRYYGRVLSSAEILALYQGTSVSGANLLLDLPLNGDFLDRTGLNTITPFATPPAGPAFAFAAPTNYAGRNFQVQAFGDSITSGSGWPGGWRINFFDAMWRVYGKPINFVGQQTDVGAPGYWLDLTHDGIAGQQLRGITGQCSTAQTGDIFTRIAPSIAAHPGTRLFIIMGGINDVGHGCTAVQARDNFRAAADEIYRALILQGGSTATPLIIATPPTYLGGVGTPALVALLPQMVTDLHAGVGGAGRVSPNVVLDLTGSSMENPQDFQADATHPVRKGYEFLGWGLARTADSLLTMPSTTNAVKSRARLSLPATTHRIAY